MSDLEEWMVMAGCGLIKPSGDNLISQCPFHNDEHRSFSMNATTGQFICFSESCGSQGGLVTFLHERCGYTIKRAIQEAEEYAETGSKLAGNLEDSITALLPEWKKRITVKEEIVYKFTPLPEWVLGLYDFCPEYLLKRGFNKIVLKSWEIGYDSEMKRVTIPVRSSAGVLVGMTKRASKEWQETKYLHLGFTKSRLLYGEHRVRTTADLWVGEGQLDAVALSQLGVSAVSTMGARVSTEQIERLRRLRCERVVLAYDADTDGRRATQRIGDALSTEWKLKVRVAVSYPTRKNPEGGKWDPAALMRYGTDGERARFLTSTVSYDDWRLAA